MKLRFARIGAAIGLLPALAIGCSCLAEKLPCRSLLAAEVVFTGRVEAVEPVDASGRESRYTFQVTRDIVRASSPTVEVSAGNDGGMCGIRFKKGEEYLIFASGIDGVLKTDLCSGSQHVRFAATTLAYFFSRSAVRQLADFGVLYGFVSNRESDLQSFTATWPVADVRVVAWQGATQAAETRTAADGTFAFFQLPEGKYRLAVEAPGDFRSQRADSTGSVAPGQCEDVSFFNTSRARLKGVLHHAEGELDDSIHVKLVPLGPEPKVNPGESSELTSDLEAGVFRFEVPPGRYRLSFREIGHSDAVDYPAELQLVPGANPEIRFRLPRRPQYFLEGIVVDASHRPVEGAHVHISAAGADGSAFSGNVLTPANGRFRFETVPLEYVVRVRTAICGDRDVTKSNVGKGHNGPLRIVVPAGCPPE
ncbi:MAG: carboxypeptidase regulatory-like domain-containing protein [Bryobacterales bacterium]|nr:carboxypeptidase regulatory-like domain-containing protein [Bryobacterales bacterium]